MKTNLKDAHLSAVSREAITKALDTQRPLYLLIIATKPCFIKLASLIKSMKEEGIPFLLVNTNQHYDSTLTSQISEFGYSDQIDYNMFSSGNNFNERISAMCHSVSEFLSIFETLPPAIEMTPLISGDTFSAGILPQLFYFSKGARSIHIEAGLRSFGPSDKSRWLEDDILQQSKWDWNSHINDPFPEGMDSRLASVSSELLFAPVERNRTNLLHEGYSPSNIYVSGSLSSDSITLILEKGQKHEFLKTYPFIAKGKWLRVDLHRRENLEKKRLIAVIEGITLLSREGMNVMLIKTNAMMFAISHFKLDDKLQAACHAGVVLCDMWPNYYDVIDFIGSQYCLGLYTDSGGLQEEANIIGTPCFTSRFSTDRPETVLEVNTNILVPPISGKFVSFNIMRVFDKGVNCVLKDLTFSDVYGVNVAAKMTTLLKVYQPKLNMKKSELNY